MVRFRLEPPTPDEVLAAIVDLSAEDGGYTTHYFVCLRLDAPPQEVEEALGELGDRVKRGGIDRWGRWNRYLLAPAEVEA